MVRIVTILAMLVAFLSGVRAEDVVQEIPQACKGRNLLADLKAKSPEVAAKIERDAAAVPNAGPLLWKITPRNGKTPSWLMGTAHVTDTRLTTFSDAVKGTITKARVVALELKEITNKKAMQATLLADTSRTRMPDGKTIWDVIPDDQEAKLRSHPMFALIPPQTRDYMQPWMLTAAISLPLCESIRSPFKASVDETVAKLAVQAGVPVKGLETIPEQLQAISGLPMAFQVKGLLAAATAKIPAEDSFNTVVELYLERKVTAMVPLMLRVYDQGSPADMAEIEMFMQRLVVKRNVIMAKRARRLINGGNAFIAVGALHLAGKEGVVQLLKNAGYRVEPAE
jgi:uncharacterized protein